jgi:hypothetical protein
MRVRSWTRRYLFELGWLELQGVGQEVLGEGKLGVQVVLEVLDSSDLGKNGSIHALLLSFAGIRNNVGLANEQKD